MANRELYDVNAAMNVLSYLMNNPQTITRDSCLLTPSDFTKTVHQIVFGAIYNIAYDGSRQIREQDIEMYLNQYEEQHRIYIENSGKEYVKQLEELDVNDEALFNSWYNKLKKLTVLRDLERNKIDTAEFYNPSDNIMKKDEEEQKLNDITIPQILDRIRLKLANIEKVNFNKDGNYFQSADKGVDSLLEKLDNEPDIGLPIVGKMLNFVCRGGRRGKMYLYSAGSGAGKSRFFMMNACARALPRMIVKPDGVGYDLQWPKEQERVYFISVEQEPEELQTMVLAYISGVEEHKMLWKSWTEEERERVHQAAQILKKYGGYLYIDRIPEPSIVKVRATMIEKILEKHIDMVVYDYIAIPEDDGTAAKRQLRSDQVLMQFSAMLKEVAVSYNVFMLTGTQITGSDPRAKMVRGFADIRDGKSIADKADFCMIGCEVTDEEYEHIRTYCEELKIGRPTQVIDIYKNRSGIHKNCKIYRDANLGNLTAQDLLITTQSFKLIDGIGEINYGAQKIVDVLDFLTRGDEDANV